MSDKRTLSGAELYRYRAAWKQGLFEAFKDQRWTPFTLTFNDANVETLFSEQGAGMRIDRWMARQGVAGFVVVERTREGRLHGHGLALGDSSLESALKVWQIHHGFVHRTTGTDLLGWVTYLMKAFGPESAYVWRKETQLGLSKKVLRSGPPRVRNVPPA